MVARLEGFLAEGDVTLPPSSPVTQLLAAVGRGDESVHEKLWALIYDELRRLAQHQMANEAPGRTLQPTALVHEAYLRLVGGDEKIQWANRRHFFGAAAKAMRRIRIDGARKRNRLKRGGGQKPGPLQGEPATFDQDAAEVLAIDEALRKLKQTNPRAAEVVEFRYFAGLTRDETATVLGLSTGTVDNEWRFARAWLRRELSDK